MTTDTTSPLPSTGSVQQLTLLPAAEVPLQFRLDAATRRRGLRHIAEIRQMLAERQASREHERHLPRGAWPARAAQAAQSAAPQLTPAAGESVSPESAHQPHQPHQPHRAA